MGDTLLRLPTPPTLFSAFWFLGRQNCLVAATVLVAFGEQVLERLQEGGNILSANMNRGPTLGLVQQPRRWSGLQKQNLGRPGNGHIAITHAIATC